MLAKACAYSTLFLSHVPCDVIGEVLLTCISFFDCLLWVVVDCVGVRPGRDGWMQSFLLLNSLRSCVAVLSCLLLSGIRNWCHPV